MPALKKATYKRAYDVMGVHYVVLADGEPIGHIAKRMPFNRTLWLLWIKDRNQSRTVHRLLRDAKADVDHYLRDLSTRLNWDGESECGPYEWEDGINWEIQGVVLVCEKHHCPVAYADAYMTSLPESELRYPCLGVVDEYVAEIDALI